MAFGKVNYVFTYNYLRIYLQGGPKKWHPFDNLGESTPI